MKSTASTVEEYIDTIDSKWKPIIIKLRNTIKNNLPSGFIEVMNYGMIGYVVPHSIYPNGYHVNPKDPLPFMNIGAQKNNVAFYHMGIYGNDEIYNWFIETYKKDFGKKLDMGKACFRFKTDDQVPYNLIKELVKKIDVATYIERYEKARERKNNR